jgi:hypothetical protein
MRFVYGVPWIEVEFGERPEGYKIFKCVHLCIETTRKDSANEPYSSGDGYLGPLRPLRYYKLRYDLLPSEYKKELESNPSCFLETLWSIYGKVPIFYI